MTAHDVRMWIAEIQESHESGNGRPLKVLDLYRAVLESIAKNPINPAPTRAAAEEALTLEQ